MVGESPEEIELCRLPVNSRYGQMGDQGMPEKDLRMIERSEGYRIAPELRGECQSLITVKIDADLELFADVGKEKLIRSL